MTLTVLFAGHDHAWPEYRGPLVDAFEEQGLSVDLVTQAPHPEKVDYLVYAPNGPVSDFSPFTGAKAVLSLWAGVEKIVDNPTLIQPLCRMVDPGLTQGMVEWVAGHVLRHHLGIDAHIHGQDGVWRELVIPPLSSERPVGILGLGTLGVAVAEALSALGFPVTGWSRTAKDVPGIRCESGQDGLEKVLERSRILVLLLPQTPETRHIINRDSLARMRGGAVILNPGRGPLIDDTALLQALDSGHIEHATLDVFEVEPLPVDHPYWAHPKVTVTPHIASATRPASAARKIAANIAGAEKGAPLQNLVDRSLGY